jgi:hypothetical protein
MKKKRWMMVVCVSKNGIIKDDVVKKMKNDDETKESSTRGCRTVHDNLHFFFAPTAHWLAKNDSLESYNLRMTTVIP